MFNPNKVKTIIVNIRQKTSIFNPCLVEDEYYELIRFDENNNKAWKPVTTKEDIKKIEAQAKKSGFAFSANSTYNADTHITTHIHTWIK